MNGEKPDMVLLAREAFPGVDEQMIARIASIGDRGYAYGLEGWYKDLDFGSDADYCYGIAIEIRRVEEALDIDDGAVHDFFVDQHGEGLLVHERGCSDPECCPDETDGDDCEPRVVLDNLDREDGSVLVTLACPGAHAIARDMQGPADSRWETPREDPDFAYAVVSDRPDLVSVLRAEGYDVDVTEYCPPSA